MQQTEKKELKMKHDWVGKVINLELCKRLKFHYTTKYAQTRIRLREHDA